MSNDTLFVAASRKKFRFATQRGEITVEQLWEIPLKGVVSIDSIAIALNDAIQKSTTKSFVSQTVTAADRELEEKLELVKYVISVRLAEQAEAAIREEKASKRRLLREAIAAQETAELTGGSVEDLKKRLAELDD